MGGMLECMDSEKSTRPELYQPQNAAKVTLKVSPAPLTYIGYWHYWRQ